ncbi:MAG: 2-oxoacid:ferredoxin oxidoreductase subunit gamma [Candidatus Bathyarchaeales archaeon]
MRLEVRVAGFGGQGIIRAGLIIAMAASLYEEKNAVQTQSYGPESRGGSCRSEVVISDDEIDFPKVTDPDILVVMSQAAYNRYAETLKSGGTLILDPDMIPQQQTMRDKRIYKVPATKMAEELGKTIIANVIMLGALTSITRIVDAESMKKAILGNIPKGTEKLNLDAFEKGYEYGKKVLEESGA